MHLRSRKKFGFRINPLHCKREPHAFYYLKEQWSFWIAALSILAFVLGNMVGQHGLYAFWASVLGEFDDSLIVYTGTVSPIEKVPDYEKWGSYGGHVDEHTYRQVPEEVLISLPRYQSSLQKESNTLHGRGNDVYSVGYLGSYETGAEGDGSHPGIDIRVPMGTPVIAMANGITTRVYEDSGFGKTIVVRHPNVPDPNDPSKTTTLFSVYAHLSALYVTEDTIVHKGEQIGASGQSGFASGPHLHFQIDRDEAPWHPYWPFTGEEARQEGLTLASAVNAGLFKSRGYLYTTNSMMYAQANYTPVEVEEKTVVVARVQKSEEKTTVIETVKSNIVKLLEAVASRRSDRVAQMLARRDARMNERLARMYTEEVVIVAQADNPVSESEPEETVEEQAVSASAEATAGKKPSEGKEEETVIVSEETVASASNDVRTVTEEPVNGEITSVFIYHDGNFSGRAWETVRVSVIDARGNTVTTKAPDFDIYLRTAYGEAEFNPPMLSPIDFNGGEAYVQMLPRGRRTVVIKAQPFGVLSGPMAYEE
ncbi:M23 family metallopeptidase [Patescibacteria group bacterium]|nr:M23 family metallopeptidase [Patescibacteria group bacterium]